MSDYIDPLERLWGWPPQSGSRIYADHNLSVWYEHLPANERIRLKWTPKRIFRFMGRGYADDFLNRGKFRIRALVRYKDDVPFNRKDTRESELSHRVGRSNLHQWIGCFAYGLCFSTHPSKRLSVKFDPVCVEIRDVDGFANALDLLVRPSLEAVGLKVNASYGDVIRYYQQTLPLSSQYGYSQPQIFLKPYLGVDENQRPNLFASEREYRFVWDLGIHDRSRFDPAEKPPALPDLFIESPDLCAFLRERPANKLCPDTNRQDFIYPGYTLEMHENWLRAKLQNENKRAPERGTPNVTK